MSKELFPPIGQERDQREKYWSECTELEKLERMRNVVKALEGQLARATARIELLEQHTHADGKLCVPINSRETSYIGGARVLKNDPEREYF